MSGIVSLIVFYWTISASGLPRGEDAVEPLALIVAIPIVAVLANIAYTAGWFVELSLLEAGFRFRRPGPVLLKTGLVFSWFVVSIPAIVWTIIWIATWFGYRPFPLEQQLPVY